MQGCWDKEKLKSELEKRQTMMLIPKWQKLANRRSPPVLQRGFEATLSDVSPISNELLIVC